MNKNYKEILEAKFPNRTTWTEEKDNVFYIESQDILDVLSYLKELGFTFLADISAVDYKEYFEVVYQLCSFSDDRHLMLKIKLDYKHPQVQSVFNLWKTADWLEREVYDLMGIKFINHPNLERILTWEGFEGYPLRKDYISQGGRE